MAKVSVSEAARLAGVARSTFYRSYISTGKVSIERDATGKPVIDTSELLRVFQDLNGTLLPVHETDRTSQCGTCPEYRVLQSSVEHLEIAIKAKDAELGRALAEIEWLRRKIDAMEQRTLAGPETKRRWWWPW